MKWLLLLALAGWQLAAAAPKALSPVRPKNVVLFLNDQQNNLNW